MFLTKYTAFKESLKVCAVGTRESGFGIGSSRHHRFKVLGRQKRK